MASNIQVNMAYSCDGKEAYYGGLRDEFDGLGWDWVYLVTPYHVRFESKH